MFRVKVRRMGSNIIAIQNGKPFIAKPDGWNKKGIVNSIKRAFTLKYDVFNDKEEMISQVEFDSLHNYILIKKDSGNIAIQIPLFYLNAQKYYLKEKLTGFQVWPIWDTNEKSEIEIVIEAKKSLTEYSIEFNCIDDNFQFILKEFALGFMIRWMSYLY
ncbi:MAG: hypothetical protein Q7J68_08350 [Thermoplasmata archaeon]|nr:hypothetical protein [Thermoplasmata archaeon]